MLAAIVFGSENSDFSVLFGYERSIFRTMNPDRRKTHNDIRECCYPGTLSSEDWFAVSENVALRVVTFTPPDG